MSFALRRAISTPLLVAGLTGLVLVARYDPAWSRELDAAGTGGLLRARTLGLGLLLLLPSLLVPAATHASRRLREEVDWLLPRLSNPLAERCLRAGSPVVIGTLLLFLLAFVAEGTGGTASAQERRVAELESPAALLETAADELLVSLPADAPDFDSLRVRATVLSGSGPAATVRLSLVDGAEPAVILAEQDQRMHGWTTLELTAVSPTDTTSREAGSQPVVLRIARVGPGAGVLLPANAVTLVADAPHALPRSIAFALSLLPWMIATILAVFLSAHYVRPSLALPLGLLVGLPAPIATGLADVRDGLLVAPAGSLAWFLVASLAVVLVFSTRRTGAGFP